MGKKRGEEVKREKRKLEKSYNSVTMTCVSMTTMTFRASNNKADEICLAFL